MFETDQVFSNVALERINERVSARIHNSYLSGSQISVSTADHIMDGMIVNLEATLYGKDAGKEHMVSREDYIDLEVFDCNLFYPATLWDHIKYSIHNNTWKWFSFLFLKLFGVAKFIDLKPKTKTQRIHQTTNVRKYLVCPHVGVGYSDRRHGQFVVCDLGGGTNHDQLMWEHLRKHELISIVSQMAPDSPDVHPWNYYDLAKKLHQILVAFELIKE